MDLADEENDEDRQEQHGAELPEAAEAEREAEEKDLFSCRIDNARAVTTVLSCLSHGSRKAQHAQCEATPEGLTFVITGKAKFTQAQGALSKDLFQAYECEEDGGRFGINLSMLLECLQIFGMNASASAALAYYPGTATFKVTLEENGVFTSCELRTLVEESDAMEFAALAAAFRSSPEECRCIIRSETLKEAFQELADLPGAASIVFEASQHAPHLKLSTSGSYGSSSIQFPRSSEAFVHFSCTPPRLRWSYALSALEGGMRALPFAQETFVRINEEGIMCIQHQVQVAGHNTYVDFLICANTADIDDDTGLSQSVPPAPAAAAANRAFRNSQDDRYGSNEDHADD